MTYAPKLVLKTPVRDVAQLAAFVEDCLRDQVELIAVVGDGCEQIHDLIEDIVIGDGSDRTRFICTSWHTGESVEAVIGFADIFTAKAGNDVQVVEI